MKNLLYIALCETDPRVLSGVSKKIYNEIDVLSNHFCITYLGFGRQFLFSQQDGQEIKISSSFNPRKEIVSLVKSICESGDYAKCYIRKGYIDPYYLQVLSVLKSHNLDVVVEIPTFPYDKEFTGSLKKKAVLLADKVLRSRIKKYVNRIATYSNDKNIYGVQCIHLENGIDVFGTQFLLEHPVTDTLHIIGVAFINNWHGFDRVIEGIRSYRGTKKICFHVVGDGPELAHLKQLVAGDNRLTDQVIFHGFLSGKELDDVYSLCDVAIDALGLHRKGMTQCSTLKSREYAAKGLPLLCSFRYNDIPDDWKYKLVYSANDEPIDIEMLIKWYEHLTTEKNYRKTIRKYAEDYFDITNTFVPVLDYFLRDCNE